MTAMNHALLYHSSESVRDAVVPGATSPENGQEETHITVWPMGPLIRKKKHTKRIYKSFHRNFGDSRMTLFPQEYHVRQRYEYQKQFYTKKDFVWIINLLIVWRGEVVTSRCHGSEPWSCRYGRKNTRKNKTVAHTFLPLFDNANGRLCQERLFRATIFAVISPGLVKPAKRRWYPFPGPPMDSMHKKQNGRPYFSSVVRQCKWPSQSRRIVQIHNFCCNLTRAG